MAFFETCSDFGTQSSVPTEKFTCRVCGKIKPAYSVDNDRFRSSERREDDQYSEDERAFFCQCDEETCCQWFKKAVGFAPEEKRRSKYRYPTGWGLESFRLRFGSAPRNRGSKSNLEVVTSESDLDSELALIESFPFPNASICLNNFECVIPTGPSRNTDARTEADAEDLSQTSRESKIKKKKRRKRARSRSTYKSESSTDSAYNRERLKSIEREAFGIIPASTATVFHTYRSRASYSFQPKHRKHTRKHNRLDKRKSNSVKNIASKNKQHSAIVSTSINVSSKTSRLELNWSAYHSEPLHYECKREILKSRFKKLPYQYRSRSAPQTKRDYQDISNSSSMMTSFYSRTAFGELSSLGMPRRKRFTNYNSRHLRSFSEPCRSKSANVTNRKRSPLKPVCHPAPYPVVLSCVSPTLRKSSQGSKGCNPTAKTRQKTGSCPNVRLLSKPRSQDISLCLLHSKLRGSKLSPDRGKRGTIRMINSSGPCCPLPQRPARNRRFSSLHGISPPASGCYRKRKGVNPKAVFCPNPCALDEKGLSKKQENAKIREIIQRCNVKKRPPRSCPPICIGNSLSPFSSVYMRSCNSFYRNASAVPRFMRVLGVGSRSTFGLNFTQSSNPGKSPDAVCSKCKNPIEFKTIASQKAFKCEFVLAPTCVKRRGPRSTVSEYLSTIEHPKPRPRAPRNTTNAQTPLGQDAASTVPDPHDAKSVESGKSSEKGSKKKKKKASADTASTPDPSKSAKVSSKEETDPVSGEDSQGALKPEVPESAKNKSPAPKEGGRDGNNNYGFDVSDPLGPSRPASSRFTDHSTHTSTRISSVPVHSYTSYMDTGYTRMNSSPYLTSNGMRTLYANSLYSTTGDFGYFRASQEFRRNIRSYYERRRLFSERSTANNSNMEVWRSTSQDVPNSQLQSSTPSSNIKVQMRSPEKARRRKVETPKTKTMEYRPRKKSKTKVETKSLEGNREEIKETPRSFSPRVKNSLPPYFPRKSFLEGEGPIAIANQENLNTENFLNKFASTSQVVSNLTAEVKSTAEASMGKINQEPQIASNTFEEMQVETADDKDCGEPGTQDGATTNADNEGSEKGQENSYSGDKGSATMQAESRIFGILEAKESSVDAESYAVENELKLLSTTIPTIRRVEPKRTTLQTLLRVTSPESMPANPITDSITAPTKATTSQVSTLQNLISSNAQPEERQVLRQARAGGISVSPIPIFQSLMDRFSEGVQIFVRTKETDIEVANPDNLVQQETKNVEKKESSLAIEEKNKPSPNDGSEDMNDGGMEKAMVKESIAAWSPENKSKNKAAPSCEATSNGVSWSDVAHASLSGVKQQPSPAGSINAQNTSAVSSSITLTVAPVQSVISIKTAAGDSTSCCAPKAKNNEMEYEMINTKETTMSAQLKSTHHTIASEHQAALGCGKTFKGELDMCVGNSERSTKQGGGLHVINPLSKLCSGHGQVGQGEDLAQSVAALSCPRNSSSEGASSSPKDSRIVDKQTVGSSVDPIPDSEIVKEKKSFLDAINGSHSMFQKVGGDSCDGSIIMTAKSRFLRNIRVHSMTNISHGKSLKSGPGASAREMNESLTNLLAGSPTVRGRYPFGAMLCKSLDNTLEPELEQRDLVRVGSLTEAMKKLISAHGTPV